MFYSLLAAIIAAISIILTEVVMGYYAVDPLLVIVVGNLAGGGVMLLTSVNNLSRMSVLWQRRNLLAVIMGGLFIYSVAYVMSFNAIVLIGAGKVALLGQLETLFVILFAIIFLGERLTRRRVIAVLLALGGTVLINFDLQTLDFNLGWGELLALLAPVSVASGIITLKPVLDVASARQVTGLAMLVGAIFLMPFMPFMVSALAIGVAALLGIGAMGVLRGISWLAYNLGLKQVGASHCAIIFLSYAFFTVVFQALVAQLVPVLGLQLPTNLLSALLGGLFIAGGIIVLQTETTTVNSG